jgi:hypothetical protein
VIQSSSSEARPTEPANKKADPSISTPSRVFGHPQEKSVHFSSIQTDRETLPQHIYRPIRILITKFEAFHCEIVQKDIAEFLGKYEMMKAYIERPCQEIRKIIKKNLEDRYDDSSSRNRKENTMTHFS